MTRTSLAVVGLASLAACTPNQIASMESRLGTDFGPKQEKAMLALPDEPIVVGNLRFSTDGSVQTLQAPAGSRCPQWYDEAMAAGWSPADWPRLDAIIQRESHCTPGAYNGKGRDNSYGLLQLNMKAHASWVFPIVNGDYGQLHDPTTNLMVGRALYHRAADAYGCGWQPWAYGC